MRIYVYELFIVFTAGGNVEDNVIIERDTESTIMFVEGARRAYLGYMTLKVRPDLSKLCLN